MIIYKPSEISTELLLDESYRTPLIICADSPRVIQKVRNSGFQTVNINTELSRKLLQYNAKERPVKIMDVLNSIATWKNSVYIDGFEMLFDPRYEIDVIKFFCEKARLINVAVKWPGTFTGSKLTYAEPEYIDYHEYDCDSYQIRIVQ